MSDVNGAAAPADTSPAQSAPELPLDTPNPVATADEGHPEPDAKPEGKPEKVEAKEPAKPISAREALQKASEKVEKDSKAVETKPTDKAADKPAPVKTEAQPRDPEGKFAPKDGDKPESNTAVKAEPKQALPSHTAGEPPARFSPDAKAAWATAPESVRAETARMERELTQGFAKHKESAEAYEAYREFDEIAKQHGKKGADVFREYYNMENALRKDPITGLDHVCQKLGLSLRQVAEHVLGQSPDQNASQQDATIRELRQQNQSLGDRLNRLEGGFNQQQQNAVLQDVSKFAADKPRFDELANDIADLMSPRYNEEGRVVAPPRAKDLPEAYALAERLNPAPATASKTEPSAAQTIDLTVQTEKGSKSINGSPTPGSSPAATRPSNSVKDAVKKAFAASA